MEQDELSQFLKWKDMIERIESGEEISEESCKFHYPNTDVIDLDFTGCKYIIQIHLRVKNAFGFPDYYGMNYDALWDCLDGYTDKPLTVNIHGTKTLAKEFQPAIDMFLEIFDEVHEENPNMVFNLIS